MAGRNLLGDQGRNLLEEDSANPVLGTIRAGLQGMTFGGSDEVGAAIAALVGSVQTGESFSDAYSKIHSNLAKERQAFQSQNPALATGAEIGGAVLSGGAGLGRALGSQAVRNMPRAAQIGATAGVGGVEGATYGGLSAAPGERTDAAMEQGALGLVAAPVVAGGVNILGRALGGVTNYAADKLAKTPKGQATQAIRNVAANVGITPEEAARRYSSMGKEATIADIDPAMSVMARAGMNQEGTMREAGLSMVQARQKDMQNRLMGAIEKTSGKSSEFKSTLDQIIQDRAAKSKPIYDAARAEGVTMTEELKNLLKNPNMQESVKQGRKWAQRPGNKTSMFDVMQQIKFSLDDRISSAMRDGEKNQASILIAFKNELVDQMPASYKQANEVFAGESALKNALELGNSLFKKSPDELQDAMKGMSQSELELVRLGGVKAIADRLDNIGRSRDALKFLTDSAANEKRMAIVLGDDAGEFLRRTGIEEKFQQTRQTLSGNSTTMQQKAAMDALSNSLDSGVVEAIKSANPGNIVSELIKVVTKQKVTPEMIDQLGKLMFAQGMTERQVINIFKTPGVRKAFGPEYDRIVAPYVRASTMPAIEAARD